jgi:hypothetical protein
MKPADYAKALGFAVLALIVDVLVAIGVVEIYARFLNPGHPRAYYEAAAVPVARWSTRIFGTALLCALAWFLAKRRPERNAYAFAAALVFLYALVDAASIAFQDTFTWSFGFTIALKLAGALLGAWVAVRSRSITAA